MGKTDWSRHPASPLGFDNGVHLKDFKGEETRKFRKEYSVCSVGMGRARDRVICQEKGWSRVLNRMGGATLMLSTGGNPGTWWWAARRKGGSATEMFASAGFRP